MDTFRKTFGAISLILLTAVFGLAWAGQAVAQEGELHQFDVGTEISYIEYEEPDIMEEKGPMYGVFGVYTYRMAKNRKVESLSDILDYYADNKMFRLDAKFSYGELDYDSTSTGSIEDIKDYMIEGRAVAGYDFATGEATTITPYAGFGFRYLNDDSADRFSTTGHAGYERESRYFYVPIGFETRSRLNDGWDWGVTVEYDIFVAGEQKSHLEDVSAALSTLENDQDSGYGVRASVRFVRRSDSMDWLIEPFVRYWDVEASDIGTITCGGTPCALGYEPENNSTEYGLKIGVGY